MKLITTLEACVILFGDDHNYVRYRSICKRMKDHPEPVVRRGYNSACNRYDEQEIIEYGKNRNVKRMMNNAFTEYRNERKQREKKKAERNIIKSDGVFAQFLRGEFAPRHTA